MDIFNRIASKTVMLANGCHGWTGSKAGHSYGTIGFNGRRTLVHRLTYELMFGPIPEGLEAHHVCENKGCINPLHIEPISHAENIWLAMPSEWNANKKKTHCPHGHSYSGKNLMVRKFGYRECLICNRLRWKKAKARGWVRPSTKRSKSQMTPDTVR